LQQAGNIFFETAISAMEQEGRDFKKISQYLQRFLHLKGRALFQPLRIAITGEASGPEMTEVFKLLSTKEILHRLRIALKRSQLVYKPD
jgi:glutamyl/glutaminyl-tRNA synthetase